MNDNFQAASEHFNLSNFDEALAFYPSPSPVFNSGAVRLSLNIDKQLLEALNEKPGSISVISGFDTAGDLHLGHLIVLEQMRYYKELGCNVRIPIVDLEAISVRGQSVRDSIGKVTGSLIPTLASLGFSDKNVYVRSQVSGILMIMAKLSRVVDMGAIAHIYSRSLSFGELFSLIFMAADLLRPQIEGVKYTIAVYGIDEAPHIVATNWLASRINLSPISATFSVLLPSLTNPLLKMSKSLQGKGANISLGASSYNAKKMILEYEVGEVCMVERIRRYLLAEPFKIETKRICTMQCSACLAESSEYLEELFQRNLACK